MGLLDKLGFGKKKSGDDSKAARIKSSKRVDIEERFERLRTAVNGTMSKFYAARDRTTDQVVGLKLCDFEKFSFFESRFKGMNKPPEGEIAAGMDHPNIIETLEYGLTNKKEPYLVMEFIDGPGLNTLIQNKDVERLGDRRLPLMKQMAAALVYVHKQGYIHRDICPRNFICTSDMQKIKLIDFGLTVPATEKFMQPGNRTGTPLYMAPEIVRRRPTDQRLDIFAFGVSCYQLLTFDFPWPGGEVSGLAALNHDTSNPRDIFKYRPDLNRALGGLIMQCVQSNPADRPPTMEAFAKTINAIPSETEA
ncbi:MAG TPA: serine/threonine protein kinase [Planctomycetaceae bacterium]|nr:serine/threonine protein kinase [Planctomycetaceae bacterium]